MQWQRRWWADGGPRHAAARVAAEGEGRVMSGVCRPTTSAAKRAADDGPVVITDRGRPAFALLNIDDYHRMVGQSEPTLLAVMDGIAGGVDIEFDPSRLNFQSQAVKLD